MSITDELREWMRNHTVNCSDNRIALVAIADRIDAEHAKAVERARMDGMDATFGDGWVKLPVDADGVPIHVGDELEIEHNGRVTTVDVMTLLDSWIVYCTGGGGFVPAQTRCHHVQPDSWEGIMDDAEKLARGDNAAVMELVERCRRLAGEGE